MARNPVVDVLYAAINLANALGELGKYILQLFGLPETIKIGSYVIKTPGIFSAFMTIFIMIALMEMFQKYWKYIAVGCLVIFFLSILASVI